MTSLLQQKQKQLLFAVKALQVGIILFCNVVHQMVTLMFELHIFPFYMKFIIIIAAELESFSTQMLPSLKTKLIKPISNFINSL